MEATITRKLKMAVVGVALAASGVVLGATGVSWSQTDGPAGGGETSRLAETTSAKADQCHQAGAEHDHANHDHAEHDHAGHEM